MNSHTRPHPPPNNPNIFILIKKQNLPKLQKLHSLHQKAKSPNTKKPKSPNTPNPIDYNHIKSQSQQFLSNQSNLTKANPTKPKIYRKNSQVSIVEDLHDTSIQENHKLTSKNQKQYVINISQCHHNDSPKEQKSQFQSQIFSLFRPNYFIDPWPQIMDKIDNFKAFFQYVLDFKLMKKNSYCPKEPEVSISKNEESTKISSRRLPNSLEVKFPEKQAEKNQLKFHQVKSQVHENKQARNRELQNSQVSLVDVRISSASIDDFTPMFRNERKMLNSSPSSDMKKSRRVYFDFENPRFSQPDCILQETNPIVQSQNNVTVINRTSGRIVTLSELKRRIQNSEEQNIVTHHGYFCDQCKVDPIVGKRYRCIQCDEYDLCELCYKKQCDKYGKILRQYEHNKVDSDRNKIIPNLNTNYLFQARPLLKKQMSDIVEEEILSQNYSSSSENLLSSSEKDLRNSEKDHVHLMEQVHKPRQIHHLNFEKILRETNRCSLRSINQKKAKNQPQNITHKKSVFNPSSHRQKLLSSIKMNKSRLAFSQRTIPLNSTQNTQSHRKILQSKRRQIQNIRKSAQSISHLLN